MVNGRRIKVMLAIEGLGLGGAEMVVRDLARSLDPRSFEVCICCTGGLGGTVCDDLIRDGVDIFALPGQREGRPDYLTPVKLRRAIAEKAVDLVHTHSMSPLLDVSPCRLLMPSLRVVHTFHYGNYPYDRWRYHLMEGLCARAADRLIAVGHDQRRRIQETYRLPESRVGMIWNGINAIHAAPNRSLREQFGTGPRLLVGTIAKLIEQKGLDTLLAVARRCRDEGLPIQFVIVGGGQLRSALEARHRELELGDTAVFAGWIHNAAQQVLPEFDVFFQPSRWEAMSIAILEAMSSARAIVATRVGDNPHVLEDEKTGILVEPGDVEGMVRALRRLLDRDRRVQIGQAARARFEERFTLTRMTGEYENLYRALTAM
jgi:glycosyltransferase involved in cell wall biosynthesis